MPPDGMGMGLKMRQHPSRAHLLLLIPGDGGGRGGDLDALALPPASRAPLQLHGVVLNCSVITPWSSCRSVASVRACDPNPDAH